MNAYKTRPGGWHSACTQTEAEAQGGEQTEKYVLVDFGMGSVDEEQGFAIALDRPRSRAKASSRARRLRERGLTGSPFSSAHAAWRWSRSYSLLRFLEHPPNGDDNFDVAPVVWVSRSLRLE